MHGEAQVGQKDPVFVPYFSIQFSTQWEASLEGWHARNARPYVV